MAACSFQYLTCGNGILADSSEHERRNVLGNASYEVNFVVVVTEPTRLIATTCQANAQSAYQQH